MSEGQDTPGDSTKRASARGLEPLLTSEIDVEERAFILVNRLNHSAKQTKAQML
jgi:hypothetical protein